jgi:hypothetical protein
MILKRVLLVSFLNSCRLPLYVVRVARALAATFLILIISASFFVSVTVADVHASALSSSHAQQAPNCVDIMVNGGFELTASGWKSMAGASLFTYATDSYVGGQYSLLLGFGAPPNIPATFGVEQLIMLPAESSSIEFAFYYDIEYDIEVAGEASPGDQAYLTIYDAATNHLLAMLVLSPTNATWSMGRYDLMPLAGKNIRLRFIVENDGEPGRLAMRVDDVALFACLPLSALALQALPTPTPLPSVTPELLPLVPLASPTAQQPQSPAPQDNPQGNPAVPQAQTVFPRAGSIDSLAACSCGSSLYACTDFSNWSIAQACYTQCQVTAGYDIHNLDEDKNGIACELELKDVAPLDATPSPQPMQSQITPTDLITPSVPLVDPGAVTTTLPPGPSTILSLPVVSQLPATPPLTTSLTMTLTTTAVTSTTALAVAGEMTTSLPTTVAVAPAALAESGIVSMPSSADAAPVESTSPTTLPISYTEMLMLLVFSPVGFIGIGTLLVLGALALWVAYMIGQRWQSARNRNIQDYELPRNDSVSLPR